MVRERRKRSCNQKIVVTDYCEKFLKLHSVIVSIRWNCTLANHRFYVIFAFGWLFFVFHSSLYSDKTRHAAIGEKNTKEEGKAKNRMESARDREGERKKEKEQQQRRINRFQEVDGFVPSLSLPLSTHRPHRLPYIALHLCSRVCISSKLPINETC